MKVTYVNADDWKGLYLDGELINQGHRISVSDVLEELFKRQLPVTGYDEIWIDGDAYDEWLAVVGQLPDSLRELKRALAKYGGG